MWWRQPGFRPRTDPETGEIEADPEEPEFDKYHAWQTETISCPEHIVITGFAPTPGLQRPSPEERSRATNPSDPDPGPSIIRRLLRWMWR